ncbi:MAG: hypothetical protein ABL956_15665 [Hyphomonadaceae bacterium]
MSDIAAGGAREASSRRNAAPSLTGRIGSTQPDRHLPGYGKHEAQNGRSPSWLAPTWTVQEATAKLALGRDYH